MKNFWNVFSARFGSVRDWRNPRRKRFWLVILILLYTLGGFLLAPWAIQSQVIPLVSEQLGRPVVIDRLRINPYALTVEARGMRLTETDGSSLLGFDRLFVNLQLSSLVRRAWTLRRISLEGPFVNFRRESSGDTNMGRFVADVLGPDPAPVETTEDTSLPRLIIGELAIQGAIIDLADFVPQPEVRSHLEPININIRDLSTLPDRAGQQDVRIAIGDHGKIVFNGSLQLDPLLADGHFQGSGRYLPIMYRYVEDLVAFEVSEGRVEFAFDYRIELRDTGELAAQIDNFDFDLRGIVMKTDQPVVEFLSLPEISLVQGQFRWPEQQVRFDGLQITGARLHVIRNPDGVLNLQQLLLPAEETPVAVPEEPLTVHPLQDWSIELGELKIDEFATFFEDQSLAQDEAVAQATINLVVRDVTSRAEADFPFNLDIHSEAGGSVRAEGQIGIFPGLVIDSALKIDGLVLQVAQPWVSENVRVEIDSGLFSADTRLGVNREEPFTLSGSLSLDSFDVSDIKKDERLVGWERIAVDQFNASLAGNSLEISEINISDPYARILIDKDQTTNFEQLVVETETDENAAGNDTGTADSADTLAVTIGQVVVSGGQADFTDLALPLPFSANIGELQGRVSSLSTRSTEPAAIELDGRVDEYGMATITGTLLPGSPAELTDIQLAFRNVDIPNLSPYTIKFAGREIADGSLDVTLKYLVENSELHGDNYVLLRELQLGDKVDHPEAANLPLGLAIALLKRPDGTIEIDLPVSGNVDDPEFSVGGLVFKAFVNLVTKAATSPFRLLGGLVDMDDAALDVIEFRPGQSGLTPPEREKLVRLTEALKLRPELRLVLQGAVDPVADSTAIRTGQVEALIDGRLEAEGRNKTDQAMLMRRRQNVIEELIREQLPDLDMATVRAESMRPKDPSRPDGRQVLDEPAYMAALQAHLTEAVAVGEQDLDALAAARAGAIRDIVLSGESLSVEHIRIDNMRTAAAITEDGWVPMALQLDTRTGAKD